MSEASRKIPETHLQPPFALELIDLNAHPDGALLRMIAEATKAREAYELLTERGYRKGMAKADRAERAAAYCAVTKIEVSIIATPARTGFGLLAKALFALEHRSTRDPEASNFTWGPWGLLFSVVNDGVRIGAFS
jgi:hypothetical protein